jgi:hypothetical protein
LNYWKSVDEPFKTNASYFNAGMSWYFLVPIMIYGTLLCVMGFVVCFIVMPISVITGKKKFKDTYGEFFLFVLQLTWDIDHKDFRNIVDKKVVRNDSKEA